MLQRKGERKMWPEYIFLFLHMGVQEKGNEPFQWIRCANTAVIILRHFKINFCSIPFFSTCIYPRDNSKGHLEGNLETGWPAASS